MKKGPLFCPVCHQQVLPKRTGAAFIHVSGRRWIELEFLPDSPEIIYVVHNRCRSAFVKMVERGKYPPVGMG